MRCSYVFFFKSQKVYLLKQTIRIYNLSNQLQFCISSVYQFRNSNFVLIWILYLNYTDYIKKITNMSYVYKKVCIDH